MRGDRFIGRSSIVRNNQKAGMTHAAAVSLVPFPRSELKSLGLVSTAHAFSHFYMLVLPPVFPLLHADLDVSYAALGLLLTVYASATGVM